MKYAIVLLLLLSIHASQGVYAQTEPVKDTLDWRGYYPLEIGNVWETKVHMPGVWFGGDFDEYTLKEIIADTVINSRPYFVQQTYLILEFEVGTERRDTLWWDYVRYDTLRATVVHYDGALGEDIGYCSLGTGFNTIDECGESIDMWVGGGYATEENFQLAIGSDFAQFNAEKTYGPGLTGGAVYYHGIGSLGLFGDGEGGTIEFTYVKVGDSEYGSRSIHVGVEEIDSREVSAVAVFPNPVATRLTLVFPDRLPGPDVRVIDVLGRSVEARLTCEERKCQLDVSSLRSGMYVLAYSSDAHISGNKTFVVVK